MKKLSVLVIGLLCFSMFQILRVHAPLEPPAVEWSKRYTGATAIDGWPYIVIQTSDGGYAIAGRTQAFGAGSFDFWLIKTDANGNMLWNRTYGGINYEKVLNVIQTNDGGYAIVGDSWSFSGWYDGLLVKTDANGNMQWNKVYGGAGVDTLWSVIQTSDGGYALAGNTASIGAGGYDYWLIKTDTFGNMQWQKTYGGSSDDVGRTVVQTSDGGYALSGATWSYGSGVTDFWLVKTDVDGNMQWNRAYGGTGLEDLGFMTATSDGGYALVGHTASYGVGGADFWLVKADANGYMQWNKAYGGANADWSWSVIETGDGGYVLGGGTASFGAGGNDFWLVRTDINGNAQWNQTYGGTGNDCGFSVVQTLDGGYALAGFTNSFSGDGSYEVWLIKIASMDITPPAINILSPQNITYTVASVPLTFTVNEPTSWIGYSLDNKANVTISGNTTLTGLSVGQHSIQVYANDTSGNMGASNKIFFTIGVHDVAVVSVVPSATEVYVGQVVNITVAVQNQGNFTETFEVTCKYELESIEYIIGAITVNNLTPQANTSIIFTWTTTDITVHTISANATILPNETDTSDNTMTSPTTVKVKILGDINGDNIIDIFDVVAWADAFGTKPEDPGSNPQADINGDDIIDVFDGVIISIDFGKTA